jgi:protein-S-isoprenylcysteine O-methyltransferase Ste14
VTRLAAIVAWVPTVVYATIPLYWFVVHPFAERWRARRRPFALIVPVWAVLIVVTGFVTYRWTGVPLYPSGWSWVAALPFFAMGASVFRRVGREKQFTGDQLIGRPEIEPGREQRLVTTGIHGHVRHPVYAAHLSMMCGWTVAGGTLASYLLLAWALVSGALMIYLEDRELERRFGPEYSAYRRRVPAIIPRLRR